MSFYYLLPPSRHSCNSIREGYSKARRSRRRRLLKSALDLSNFENWISNELREAWRVAIRWIRFLFGILRNSFRNDIDNDLLLQRVNDTIPSCWYLKAKSSYRFGMEQFEIIFCNLFILEPLSNERHAFGPRISTDFLYSTRRNRGEIDTLGWKAGQLSVHFRQVFTIGLA